MTEIIDFTTRETRQVEPPAPQQHGFQRAGDQNLRKVYGGLARDIQTSAARRAAGYTIDPDGGSAA